VFFGGIAPCRWDHSPSRNVLLFRLSDPTQKRRQMFFLNADNLTLTTQWNMPEELSL